MTETDDERRRKSRYVTCVPAGVKTADKERLALIRDASASGAMLLSQSQFPVGERVTLGVVTDASGKPSVELAAQVVRIERIAEGIWTCKMAVEFVPHRPDLVPFFQNLESDWRARNA